MVILLAMRFFVTAAATDGVIAGQRRKLFFLVLVVFLLSSGWSLSAQNDVNKTVEVSSASTDGRLNAGVCATSSPAAWCRGNDIGAYINAAIGQLYKHSGVVVVPTGEYDMKTTVIKPRGVILDCENSKITFASGVYVAVGDNNPDKYDNVGGGIQNCWFSAAKRGQPGGIFQGGDPTGVILPRDYGAQNQFFYNVRVQSFDKGYITGNEAYLSVWFNSYIAANNYGVSVDVPGETITFINTLINNNKICGVQNNSGGLLRFFGGSIDYNGPDTAGLAVCGDHIWHESHGTHYEQYAGPIFSTTSTKFHNIYIDGGEMQLTTGRQKVTNIAVKNGIASVTVDGTYGYFPGAPYVFGPLAQATWLSGMTVTLTDVDSKHNKLTFKLAHADYASTADSGNIAPAASEQAFIDIPFSGTQRVALHNVNFLSGHQVKYYVHGQAGTGAANIYENTGPKWQTDACGTVKGPGTCDDPGDMSVASDESPKIASGFGTSPFIIAANGTTAFRINVGTGSGANSGTISMPASARGWNCHFSDLTTHSSFPQQSGDTTRSVTVTNYNAAGSAVSWVSGDVISASCAAL